eukprot:jgi/Psemu1/42353/gm1.42353_g
MYRWLKFGQKLLLSALQHHPAAKFCLPNEEEIQQYADAIAAKYSMLAPHRVWGACDGLKLHIQQSGNWMKQNQYYNGWTCGTYVNSVFIFAHDGRIWGCILNAPGCWHDSTQANYGLYEKMELMYDKYLAKLIVDSVFKLSRKPYLMWSSQHDPFNAADLIIQGGFPRMKDSILLEETGDRKIILKLLVCLYNFQTAKIGINTILNTILNTYMSQTEGFFSYNLVPSETANDVFNPID